MKFLNTIAYDQCIICFIIGVCAGYLLRMKQKTSKVRTKLLEFKSDIFINRDLEIDPADNSRKNDIHHISFDAVVIFDNLTHMAWRFYDFKVNFRQNNSGVFTVLFDRSQDMVQVNKKSHMYCDTKYINVLPGDTKELNIHMYINVNDYTKIQDSDEIVLVYHDIKDKQYTATLFKGSIRNNIRSKYFET